MACLETDFVIALIRKDKDALEKLRTLVEKGERITTTPIKASELYKGAYLSERVDKNHELVKRLERILAQKHKLSIKMRSKLLFWNIPQSLSENSSNSAFIQFLMHGNSQSLLCPIR